MSLVRTVPAFAFAMLLSIAPVATAASSQLPPTVPGLGRDEGVFLVTAADSGSRVVYFIANDARHAITDSDLQVEQQLNSLWPMRDVAQDEALAYPEGSPIGNAPTGLLGAPAPAPVPAPATDVVVDEPQLEVAMPEAPAATDSSTYTLKRGDNLTHIARDHGTTVEAILQANGISNANRVYAGQTLVIPGSAPAVVADQVPAPAPEAAAVEQPADAATPESSDAPATYQVQAGDSAITIARKLGINVDDLLAANGVTNRNRIYAGQILTVPATSS